MAKKDKNSLNLRSSVYGTPTINTLELKAGANKLGEWFLLGLGAFGKIMTAPFVQLGPTSDTIYKSKKLLAKEKAIELKSEELLGKAMTWMSPLNYGAALATGNGLNARKGEEEVASWSPAWQAIGRLGELYAGPKAVKGVKATPRVVVNAAAKAGVKPAKAAVVAREIKLGIKLNTKNGRIEVTGNYFNSPDKWYRVSERPEKIGIEELGKNITTQDDPEIPGTIGNWRSTILDNRKGLNGKSKRIVPKPDNGFVLEEGMNFAKHGQAHGNTSQAAKGLIWDGTFAFSNRFPIGIIEGQAPNKIFRGMTAEGKDSRSNFVLLDWEDVPIGSRVGFHTGEMPMSNLGWFQRTNKGTYTYEPIISEKRISYQPKLLLDSPTSLKFFERKPSKINEAERAGVSKEVRNRKVPLYTLLQARQEALKFAKEWGYELPENASLLLIEELYNLHNTFFRGVTTEGLETTKNRIAKELNINPKDLTKELYLLYVSTHSWPGNDRIWVTPMSHYGEMYGSGDMIRGGGLLSAVMRPWKSTKDIKLWPKLAEWLLGFKEDVLNPVITPWVSNNPNAIRSTGALSEFLIKSPLIYRGLGLNFKGTLLLLLKYNDGQGRLGWIESLVGELPTEIYINIKKLGGKMNMIDFLKNGSGIHIKKENRGKFTDYCGGKVTSECIAKGKSSSNPAIRKRATFAANARKWKHESGGSFKGYPSKAAYEVRMEEVAGFKKGGLLRFLLEGGKNAAPSNKFLSKGWFKLAGLTINGIANNVGDFFGTDLGKGLLDVGKGLFSGYLNYKSNSSAIESQLASGKASLEETYQNSILEAVKNKAIRLQQFREKWKEALANGTTNDNFSDIVASHFGQEEYNSAVRNAEDQMYLQQAAMEAQARNAKGSMMGNLFGSVVLNGLGALGGILGGSKSTNVVKTPTSGGLSNDNKTFTSAATGITASVDDWKRVIQG